MNIKGLKIKITKRQLKRLIDESMHDEMADHDITASPPKRFAGIDAMKASPLDRYKLPQGGESGSEEGFVTHEELDAALTKLYNQLKKDLESLRYRLGRGM